jgi:hypothetical protein
MELSDLSTIGDCSRVVLDRNPTARVPERLVCAHSMLVDLDLDESKAVVVDALLDVLGRREWQIRILA